MKPAPNAANNSVCPRWIRPSRIARSSASGIEAPDQQRLRQCQPTQYAEVDATVEQVAGQASTDEADSTTAMTAPNAGSENDASSEIGRASCRERV